MVSSLRVGSVHIVNLKESESEKILWKESEKYRAQNQRLTGDEFR